MVVYYVRTYVPRPVYVARHDTHLTLPWLWE